MHRVPSSFRFMAASDLSLSLSSRSHYKHNLRTEFTVTAAVSVTRFLSSLNSQADRPTDRRRGQGRGAKEERKGGRMQKKFAITLDRQKAFLARCTFPTI